MVPHVRGTSVVDSRMSAREGGGGSWTIGVQLRCGPQLWFDACMAREADRAREKKSGRVEDTARKRKRKRTRFFPAGRRYAREPTAPFFNVFRLYLLLVCIFLGIRIWFGRDSIKLCLRAVVRTAVVAVETLQASDRTMGQTSRKTTEPSAASPLPTWIPCMYSTLSPNHVV